MIFVRYFFNEFIFVPPLTLSIVCVLLLISRRRKRVVRLMVKWLGRSEIIRVFRRHRWDLINIIVMSQHEKFVPIHRLNAFKYHPTDIVSHSTHSHAAAVASPSHFFCQRRGESNAINYHNKNYKPYMFMLFNVSFHLVFLFETHRRKQQFQIFFADKCYHASWVYTFFASHISTPKLILAWLPTPPRGLRRELIQSCPSHSNSLNLCNISFLPSSFAVV